MKKQSKKPGKSTSRQEFDEAVKRALSATDKEIKIRINTFIDFDIYKALQEEAERTGQKYQTLLNKYLRAAVMQEVSEADIKAIKIALSS
ncbi:MAG: hypothetical protein AB7I27_15105 [Bacteriovoracaceae bacterium]